MARGLLSALGWLRLGTLTLWLMTLVCVALLGVGAYSFYHGVPADTIWIPYSVPRPHFDAIVVRGVLHLVETRPSAHAAGWDHQWGGFYSRCVRNDQSEGVGFGGPVWYPAGLLALAPAWLLARGPLRRRRLRRQFCCLHCGYNLTGLTEPRCPECGRPFTHVPTVQTLPTA